MSNYEIKRKSKFRNGVSNYEIKRKSKFRNIKTRISKFRVIKHGIIGNSGVCKLEYGSQITTAHMHELTKKNLITE